MALPGWAALALAGRAALAVPGRATPEEAPPAPTGQPQARPMGHEKLLSSLSASALPGWAALALAG